LPVVNIVFGNSLIESYKITKKNVLFTGQHATVDTNYTGLNTL